MRTFYSQPCECLFGPTGFKPTGTPSRGARGNNPPPGPTIEKVKTSAKLHLRCLLCLEANPPQLSGMGSCEGLYHMQPSSLHFSEIRMKRAVFRFQAALIQVQVVQLEVTPEVIRH